MMDIVGYWGFDGYHKEVEDDWVPECRTSSRVIFISSFFAASWRNLAPSQAMFFGAFLSWISRIYFVRTVSKCPLLLLVRISTGWISSFTSYSESELFLYKGIQP